MRNKGAAVVIILLFVGSSLFSVPMTVDGVTSGDYGYAIINNGTAAEITSYSGPGGVVSIPSAIDGHPVLSIGGFAFFSVSNLTKMIIPEGVNGIGFGAFYQCTSMTSVTIPKSVTSIGNGAFYDCRALSSVVLPNRLAIIDEYAFFNCNLTSIVIPQSVRAIGENAFLGCHNLTSISLPKNMTVLANGVFGECRNLASITVPAGVVSVGDGAFFNCSSLRSVALPENVSFIGDKAFQGCGRLSQVTLGPGLVRIGTAAFSGCVSLTSVTVPDGVSSIGNGAFFNCTKLGTVRLGGGVGGIGALTFFNCRSLSSVDIPDSVTFIGNKAFFNCTRLTTAAIGAGVSDIGSAAFQNCYSLTSVDFRSSAPSLAGDWIAKNGTRLVITYYSGANGFTAPLWESLRSQMDGSMLAAPGNLTSVLGPASVSLSWDGLKGNGSSSVDYYTVYQDGADVRHVTSGTSAVFSGLEKGRNYTYQISAHSSSLPGLRSTLLTAGPVYALVLITVNITSPAENASVASQNVDLRWAVEGNSFVVAFISISVDNASEVRLPASATSYTITGAAEGMHHANVTVADGHNASVFQGVSFMVNETIDKAGPTDDAPLIVTAVIAAAAIALLAAVLVYRQRRTD